MSERSRHDTPALTFTGKIVVGGDPTALRLLSLFGVRHIVLPDTASALRAAITAAPSSWNEVMRSEQRGWTVFAGRDTLPRAYVAYRSIAVGNNDAALQRLRDPAFDPHRDVVIEDPPSTSLTGAAITPAEITTYTATHVRIEAQAEHDGYLVLSDRHYPGWTATVDGSPVEILRANALFRTVAVRRGFHEIEMRYRPRSFLLGAALSIAALVACTALALWRGSRSRPRRNGSGV